MNIIPEAIYKGRVRGYDFGEAKNGTEQVGVAIDLYGESFEDFVGNLTWYGYFTEGAIDITLKGLRTLGWTGEDVTDLREIVDSEVDFDCVVRHEDYEGETSARIAFINSPGGVRIAKRMEEGKKEALKNRVRARLLASGEAKPQAPAPRRQRSAPKTGRLPQGDTPEAAAAGGKRAGDPF